MALKKTEDPPKGSPAWMATFSDLMNLLLCFFVLLFSMSSIDAEKFQEVAASLASSFSILTDGSASMGDGVLISSGVSQLNELSEYYNNMGLNTEGNNDELNDAYEEVLKGMITESENMAEDLTDKLGDNSIAVEVEVVASSQYVALNLKSGILFESGHSKLKDESEELLLKVGQILQDYNGYTIEIIGHTDNLPTTGSEYANNRVLSFFRANTVYDYFVEKCNLDKKYMKVVGRGEQEPVASNDTEEGRALNRRVEIRIYNKLSGI